MNKIIFSLLLMSVFESNAMNWANLVLSFRNAKDYKKRLVEAKTPLLESHSEPRASKDESKDCGKKSKRLKKD